MPSKMDTLFAQHPPKEPLVSLPALVRDWKFRFGANGVTKHMRDEVVEYCARARTLTEAIDRACASRRPNGKIHNHQSRVPKATRDLYASCIKRHLPTASLRNFDDLHDFLEHIAPAGIGPVTVYDVATRIAAFLKLEVCSLYLHAGVKEGWTKLYGNKHPAPNGRVPREDLPPVLCKLPTDEIEDFLCTYRSILTKEMGNEAPCRHRSSRTR